MANQTCWYEDSFSFECRLEEFMKIYHRLVEDKEEFRGNYFRRVENRIESLDFLTNRDGGYILQMKSPYSMSRYGVISILSTQRKIVEDKIAHSRVVVDTCVRLARQLAQAGAAQ